MNGNNKMSEEKRKDGAVTLEVYDPTGAVEVTVTFAKRLDTLAGKTVAQVGNSWEGHRTHALIKELLEKMYPTMKIIPHTEMPDYTDPELLAKAVREKKCDAVIFGNAG
jgi:acetylornithine/succinyldiaminopimelate/putrescine aminotransferase